MKSKLQLPRLFQYFPLSLENLIDLFIASEVPLDPEHFLFLRTEEIRKRGINAWNNLYINWFHCAETELKDVLCLADSSAPMFDAPFNFPTAPFIAQFFPTVKVFQSDINLKMNIEFEVLTSAWSKAPLHHYYKKIDTMKSSDFRCSKTAEFDNNVQQFDLVICQKGLCRCFDNQHICAGPSIQHLEKFLHNVTHLLKPKITSIAILHGRYKRESHKTEIAKFEKFHNETPTPSAEKPSQILKIWGQVIQKFNQSQQTHRATLVHDRKGKAINFFIIMNTIYNLRRHR